MDYITGSSGNLGTVLLSLLTLEDRDYQAIPHETIYMTKLPDDVDNFFFLSTYGNLASQQEEAKIIQANVTDLIHILTQLKFNNGLRSFVFVSTSSVKRKVQTMYSRTKKAAEEILLAYAEKYNAPICIVRPLSITGVGDQPEHLIPTLIHSCKTGAEMPFVADAYHDYIDNRDVAEGILTLSEHHARGIFELGTGTSRSNEEVREMVEKEVGKRANIKPVSNLRAYDSSEWVSTNFKARQYGWEPKIPLAQTIRDMVEAYD